MLPISASCQDFVLKQCYQNQAHFKNKIFTFSYSEKQYNYKHASYPWEKSVDILQGYVFIGDSSIVTEDLINDKIRHTLSSESMYASTKLDSDELQKLTIDDFENRKFKILLLLEQMFKNKLKAISETPIYSIYELNMGKDKVEVYINKNNKLIDKISKYYYDELYGDLVTTVNFKDYKRIEGKYFASKIDIEKFDAKLVDEVVISDIRTVFKFENKIKIPTGYQLDVKAKIDPQINYKKYSNGIHLLEFSHTDDRVLIVEFENYLIVAEAPLNSQNGELIISKAKELFPSKPIKYFVFGHYHPHYIGGIRAFVHNDTKIICSDVNKDYATYLSNTKHTLNPDNQELEKKRIQIQIIKDKLIFSDQSNEMQIYFIGDQSAHSNDYLIYYFPREKMVFQDDLVWIKSDSPIEKASKRQQGLYNALKKLNLDVTTILQSWPISDYGVKTVIPYKDIEKSIINFK